MRSPTGPGTSRTAQKSCGYSSKPAYGRSIDTYCEQLVDLLDALGVERAHVEGESLGGWVGLWFALHHPDRLTEPLVRGSGGELQPATWEHALEVAATGLKEVKERHGPQSIGVLASARLTMEENFLIQKLARTALGTHSVHSCEAT